MTKSGEVLGRDVTVLTPRLCWLRGGGRSTGSLSNTETVKVPSGLHLIMHIMFFIATVKPDGVAAVGSSQRIYSLVQNASLASGNSGFSRAQL